MSNFYKSQTIVRSMAAVIAGCWAYCLVVAPLLSERSYGEVVAEKSKDIGLGFTLAVLLIGVMWLFVARRKSAE
ncbi:Hypothetical protein Cul210931_0096 [Corynebacterium ulcerans]|uniref:hypothetical protein n=1 Tax=Corynebacterium ulcerans TaxID=65058 RepID=UPI0005211995|nr:hypothetical protein [Corynebacterium ulcerans]AIU29469.1 Hypothetical protein Cul210931_0096 [Corynebacterium ulcerans]